ncbi:MAG TPA: hypothetical protein VFR94_08435 [Nitrososphaeraceae archaeon]|nr:hypothetical protein [Nitrososphaeraceae archaeon]
MNSKAIVAVIAIGISFAAAITPLFVHLASASVTQCTPEQNPAGKTIPGQLTCDSGEGTEDQNPAGNSPPGRNK